MLPRKTRSVGSRVEPDDGDDAPRDARGEADRSRRRLDAVPEGARADAGHRAEDRRRRRGRSAGGGFSDRFSPYPRIRRNRGIRRNRSLHRSLHRLHRSLRVADVSAGARRNKNPFLRFLRFVVFAPERSPAPPSPRETLRVHARVPDFASATAPRRRSSARAARVREVNPANAANRRRVGAPFAASRRAFASERFFQTPVLEIPPPRTSSARRRPPRTRRPRSPRRRPRGPRSILPRRRPRTTTRSPRRIRIPPERRPERPRRREGRPRVRARRRDERRRSVRARARVRVVAGGRDVDHDAVHAVDGAPRSEEIGGVSQEPRDEEETREAPPLSPDGQKRKLGEPLGPPRHPPPGGPRADAAEDDGDPRGAAEVREGGRRGDGDGADDAARRAERRQRRRDGGRGQSRSRTEPRRRPARRRPNLRAAAGEHPAAEGAERREDARHGRRRRFGFGGEGRIGSGFARSRDGVRGGGSRFRFGAGELVVEPPREAASRGRPPKRR